MKNYLELGNWNGLCDSCGRKFKALDLRRRWDGLMVCAEDYEIRHPSDFLRVQREKIAVDFSRPPPTEDTFIGPSCSVSDTTGRANVGTADCARVEYLPVQVWDSGSINWIYKDLYPAIAGLALAGESTSGVIHSLRPGV
jgi:hypothetical protein